MIVLGIDTATARMSCALHGEDGPLASFFADEGRRHTELLAPAIEGLCAEAGLSLSDVDLLAVDVGPGLFTGLRVGIATAAALASALGRPAVGLTSTDVVAETHHRPGRRVVAVIDARRGELAWARYPEGGGAPEAGPSLATAEKLSELLASFPGQILVVGDGALRWQEAIKDGPGARALPEAAMVQVDATSLYPSAAVLAGLAQRRFFSGELEPGDLSPRYLRPADVRIGWAQRDQGESQPLPAGGRP